SLSQTRIFDFLSHERRGYSRPYRSRRFSSPPPRPHARGKNLAPPAQAFVGITLGLRCRHHRAQSRRAEKCGDPCPRASVHLAAADASDQRAAEAPLVNAEAKPDARRTMVQPLKRQSQNLRRGRLQKFRATDTSTVPKTPSR